MSANRSIEIVQKFLTALETFDLETLTELIGPDAARIEWPNRLKPAGNRQTGSQMLEDAARARSVISAQTYDIVNLAASDNLVMAEVVWTGTLAIPVGKLAVGDRMTAHCVVAIDISNDKISGVRNYDCFDDF